jgi:hemerythrin
LELTKKIYLLANKTIEEKNVQKLLGELIRYMKYHFNSEELLMQVYQYPKYIEQRNQHDKLLIELESKYAEIESGEGNLVQLLFMMMKWFIDHDIEFDKEFSKFVTKIRADQ